MSATLILLAVLKSLVVVGWVMTLAAVLTWVDRRQGAMMQDRVGPNRAVIWLPTRVAQGLLLLSGLGVAGIVAYLPLWHPMGLPVRPARRVRALVDALGHRGARSPPGCPQRLRPVRGFDG
jgi:hypothetical protein